MFEPAHKRFVDILLNMEIRSLNLIFSRMEIIDQIAFALSSKIHYHLVKAFWTRAYAVKNILEKYFSDDEADLFRAMQMRTGLIISGSTALQFFSHLVFESSDLDLYVHVQSVLAAATFLLSIGWSFAPTTSMKRLPTDQELTHHRVLLDGYLDLQGSLVVVLNFVKSGQKIQVTPVAVIMSFHSTCVLSFITHYTAYSLYHSNFWSTVL
ncbi:hypothetical protein C8J56DRAFT_1050887 [Mycena floridula]|nr:hypothetical protein C8J56DRAFT_1050887 [Mycena floridula]